MIESKTQFAVCIESEIQDVHQVSDDLAECQGNDREIVAAQTQDRDTDNESGDAGHDRCRDDRYDQDQRCEAEASLKHSGNKYSGESSYCHEARMSKGQLPGNTYYEVEGDRERNIDADRNKLSLQIVSDDSKLSAELQQDISDNKDAV